MTAIMLIDDEAEIREIYSEFLRAFGYSVVTATNGREGVAIHRGDPVDVLITDIFMPVQEGIETIMEFRRNFPEVKIIAISGGGSQGNRDCLTMAKELGADAALFKPFSADALRDAVKTVLSTGSG